MYDQALLFILTFVVGYNLPRVVAFGLAAMLPISIGTQSNPIYANFIELEQNHTKCDYVYGKQNKNGRFY